MTVVFLIGPSITVVILVIGVLHWTLFLVVSRSATQRIRNLDYVLAANAIGASKYQIIFSDIIPNILNQIIGTKIMYFMNIGDNINNGLQITSPYRDNPKFLSFNKIPASFPVNSSSTLRVSTKTI